MATRYEKIIEHLNKKRSEDLRICDVSRCACKGCCGQVGEKRISKHELAMYKSGEMQKIVGEK